MLPLLARAADEAPLRLLAIGAHSDDIEIGCGGTILKLIDEGSVAEVCWVVLTGETKRAAEARQSAEALVGDVPSRRVILKDFRDGFFPYVGGSVKDFFEELKRDFAPDLILTHQRHDLHQDHRLVSELTWNTFRDHLILEYEVPKYDGDLGAPNFFVHLTKELAARKVAILLEHFGTQLDRRWFTEDLFLSMMRIRGMESNAPESYAEAFYCRKAVL
jgi:LmbE family N-acetylglucosaminyl deacetylase